jgi:uncharacterized repeat protein (TIGR01451 family)
MPHIGRIWNSLRAACAVGLLLLASCQSLAPVAGPPVPPHPTETQASAAESIEGSPLELPGTAQASDAGRETTACLPREPLYEEGPPIPIVNVGPWAPSGIEGPWPRDEYLHDGGDTGIQVNLDSENGVHGLELEDTVAVYDTIDGTHIQPSNRVCLYAPRFAAVRQVTSVIENLQNDQLIAMSQPLKPQLNQEDSLATTAVQPIQPKGGISTRHAIVERTQEGTTPAISTLPVLGMEGGFATYENLLVMRKGMFEESEKARLMEGIDAAITWTHDLGVQVVLDGVAAVDFTGEQKAQVTYRVDLPSRPCLRVIKIASTKTAKPGDIVEFTIRFDNLGDQEIKHVELIDNLTTRLEYVPQTAQSSRRSEFSSGPNDGDSLTLRWDFVDPLPVGAGGLVRFNCRVR